MACSIHGGQCMYVVYAFMECACRLARNRMFLEELCVYGLASFWRGVSFTNAGSTALTQGQENQIFIILQNPVTISMIKFWNYSRTPQRGAAEIRITVDGQVAYQGYLRRAPAEGEANCRDFSQVPRCMLVR